MEWPSLAEELSSVESGQACFPSTPAPKNSVSRAPPPRLARASAHALAGSAEAQRKLGLLLAKGGAGLVPDVAKAKGWLQQAAAQNDAEAKTALDTLPK